MVFCCFWPCVRKQKKTNLGTLENTEYPQNYPARAGLNQRKRRQECQRH